jgi:hypothetical protein
MVLARELIALLIIAGIPTVIALTRYFLPNPLFTAAPPRFVFFWFVLALAIFISLISWLSGALYGFFPRSSFY